jgi:hypothetical protein
MVLDYRQRKASPVVLAGKICALIGVIFVVVGVLIAGYTLISLSGTVATQGTILSCNYSKKSCQPTVSFRSSSGQQFTFRSSWDSSLFAPQDTVTVRYHPDNPQDAQVDPWIIVRFIAPIFVGVGLILILVRLFLLLFPMDISSARVVDRYYTAMENQDYTTAFQYLNQNMKTREGQPITLGWFIERAQAYDTASGRVTNYTLRRFRLNPTDRDFVLKVTRGGKSYLNHLRLRKEDNMWKIYSFDLF